MEYCFSVPKVELHAHLNGSIRDSTLLELARASGEKDIIDFLEETIITKNDLPLLKVFKLFDVIRVLTTDHMTITRITREVIEDFASENVVYLELRTTPKRNDLVGMSKRSYMEAVIKGLRDISSVDVDFVPNNELDANFLGSSCTDGEHCSDTGKRRIYVRLLLSIDRRETTAAALETVMLALEMRHLGVVGIDLSGNPTVGEWNTFFPALKFAKEQGLYVTLHCGEVPNPEEIDEMLNFGPHRIGHASFIVDEQWVKLLSSEIPVEICFTSNIRTLSVPSIETHHFAELYRAKHPLIICTDDPTVFSTSLSNEYRIAMSSFGLGDREIFQLSKNAVEFIFASEEVKEDLRITLDSTAKALDL